MRRTRLRAGRSAIRAAGAATPSAGRDARLRAGRPLGTRRLLLAAALALAALALRRPPPALTRSATSRSTT